MTKYVLNRFLVLPKTRGKLKGQCVVELEEGEVLLNADRTYLGLGDNARTGFWATTAREVS